MGIRDFIELLREHHERAGRAESLGEAERAETLREAEMMVGMADAAVKELEAVIQNRRLNLPEEHAVRFAQEVFLYLRDEENRVKGVVRDPSG